MWFKRRVQATKTQPNSGVSIVDTGPCQKSLRLTVGLDVIGPVRTAVVEELRRRATLPGFRKGKAPADLIEQQHAQVIHEEMLQRVTKQTLERVVQEADLRPVGPFEFRRTDFSQDDGLTLEATVEVEPDFPLGPYKGVTLTRDPISVTPEEIDQGLKAVQESMGQLVPKGEGQPKERQLPALDDELAKDAGLESLEQLKEHVAAKLREQKRSAQAHALEAALSEELLKRHTFEVPPTLVSRQVERLTQECKARLLLSGMAEGQVEDELKRFTERLRHSAEQQVKLSFILDRIAATESVSVKEDELLGRLWQVARRWQKDPIEVRKIFDAQGLWPSVISTIRHEKTMALLMEAAVIDDGGPA